MREPNADEKMILNLAAAVGALAQTCGNERVVREIEQDTQQYIAVKDGASRETDNG